MTEQSVVSDETKGEWNVYSCPFHPPLTSPSTTFRSRRRRMGTREVRTVSEEWKEWRTERTERVPLPTSLRSSRRLLTFPPHPTAARPERNVVKWRGVRDEWREWGTNGRSEEWGTYLLSLSTLSLRLVLRSSSPRVSPPSHSLTRRP